MTIKAIRKKSPKSTINATVGKYRAKDYYNKESEDYIQMYTRKWSGYPDQLIRLNIIQLRLRAIRKEGYKNILDVGCGSCGPMIQFLKEGFIIRGVDFAEKMIIEGKNELKKAGFDPNLISQGDLENDSSLPEKEVDVIIALGVFPHIINESRALENIRKRLRRNGKIFIEFRNDLFSAFTLNTYSKDFFLNRLIDVDLLPTKIKRNVLKFYSKKLTNEKPVKRKGKLPDAEILAKFHNPLTVGDELFKKHGFVVNKIHFYHYHALPPIFEKDDPNLFKKLSLKLENPSDWKGYFMASSFVVEATKIDETD